MANKQQKREQVHKFALKAALVLVSTFVIVFFLPRSGKFSYDYSVDKPWRYGQLIATFKFPIYKDDAVVKHERDSVLRRFQPYFNLDEEEEKKMLKNLYTTKLDEWKFQNASLYVKHIAEMLVKIYGKGVISSDEYDKLTASGVKAIRVVKNNEAQVVPLTDVYTTRSAYEYIMKSDSIGYSKVVMQRLNLFELLVANLKYDKVKSENTKNDLLSSVSLASGLVQSGQKIIDRGEIVTRETYNILRSYEREADKHISSEENIPYLLIAQTVFVSCVLIILICYLGLFRNDYYDKIRTVVLLFSLMVFFCVIASIMVSHKFMHIFMLPCTMLPIIIRVFMDSRTAFMFHCATVAIISLILSSQYEFLLMQLLSGMIAIQTMRELSQRSQIIRTAVIILLSYCVFYAAYAVIIEGDIMKIDTHPFIYFFINGVLLLFTYPLLYLLEKGFGFISDVTLVELSNNNNPLLQHMSEIAPGTFQHSMQVANLASEVARKIGARAQLVRTGALYHDIGKTERPVFFTENQSGISPHKHLSPQKSAEVIIAHVANGLALASKNNLPDSIKRFIATHHGKGMAKYFYITYKNEHPDEEIDTSLFTYPGPNPATKEEAILMMADSVEAASRSLPEYTEESISNLVDKIIDGQVADGFFRECDITFRDIEVAKETLKEKLKTIYHTRISYPELNDFATV